MPVSVVPIAWDSPEAEHARRIRFAVFVDEQRVPAEMELDEIDPIAHHVLAWCDGKPAATGRMFEDPAAPGSARIGRMAVLAEARGIGAGRAVLDALIAEAERRGFRRIVLDSQTHAMGFYEKAGFVAYGPEHDDAGIPHRMMERAAGGAQG